MMDLTRYHQVDDAFMGLLEDLSSTWSEQDIKYVQEEVGHREYDDALENLIALGLSNGKGFRPDHKKQIEAISKILHLDNSSFLLKLRQGGSEDKVA